MMALTSEEHGALMLSTTIADWDSVIHLAIQLEDLGRLEDSELVLNYATDAGYPPACHNMGLLLEQQHETEKALFYYRKAIGFGYTASAVEAGRLLESLGRYDEAEIEYRKVSSSDTEAQVNLGLMLLAQERIADAKIELAAAALREPRYNWQLSDALVAEGDLKQARELLASAVAAGEARAARDLAKVVDQNDETLVRTLYKNAIDNGAIGATADYIEYLQGRGHTSEALLIAAEAVAEGDTYAPLIYARLLAALPARKAEARAMFLLAATNGDDIRDELSDLEQD